MSIGFMELKNAMKDGDLDIAAAQMVAMYWQSSPITGVYINDARSEIVRFNLKGRRP